MDNLKAGDADRQPENSCCAAGHNIAELVYTQIQPTDSDRDDQHRLAHPKPHVFAIEVRRARIANLEDDRFRGRPIRKKAATSFLQLT